MNECWRIVLANTYKFVDLIEKGVPSWYFFCINWQFVFQQHIFLIILVILLKKLPALVGFKTNFCVWEITKKMTRRSFLKICPWLPQCTFQGNGNAGEIELPKKHLHDFIFWLAYDFVKCFVFYCASILSQGEVKFFFPFLVSCDIYLGDS